MNRTKIQAVLGFCSTLVGALGFAALAHAGGGDNDNPYNMPRALSAEGAGGNMGGGTEDGASNSLATAVQPGAARGPLEASPQVEKKAPIESGATAAISYSVAPGAQFNFVPALAANQAAIEVKHAQIKTSPQTPARSTGTSTLWLAASGESNVRAKNGATSVRVQGAFEIQPGATILIAQLPANRSSALAAISIGTVGSNGSFAVEQMITVPVTTAGLDLSKLAKMWAAMPDVAGKTIKVDIGAGEPTTLATITFAAGVAKPAFRVDTQPTAP